MRASPGLIWAEAGFASIAWAATESRNFLPLTSRSFLARQESSSSPSSAGATGPNPFRGAAASIATGLAIAIEAAMGAGSNSQQET